MFFDVFKACARSTAVLACLLALAGCRDPAPRLDDAHGVDFSGQRLFRDFRLEDTEGNARTLADYRGKVVLLFFGFARCPDICPTALLRAQQIRAALGDASADLQVLFVSLDPEHDTPELLRTYVGAFDPSFVGLRGSTQQVDAAVASFNAVYAKVPAGNGYTIDHSTWTYLIDRQGMLRVGLRHAQPLPEYVADVKQVLALQ